MQYAAINEAGMWTCPWAHSSSSAPAYICKKYAVPAQQSADTVIETHLFLDVLQFLSSCISLSFASLSLPASLCRRLV